MSDNEKVGYGKPPERSRFKKGGSGNPMGRPKNAKDFKTDLVEELAEQIEVREDGRSRKISKQRAIVKRLIASTATGDPRMAAIFTRLCDLVLDLREETAPPAEEPLNADERDVLRVLRERLARADALAAEVPATNAGNTEDTTDDEEDPGTDGEA